MRKRIYSIIEVASDGDRISAAYDILMLCAIIISIIPLAFKDTIAKRSSDVSNVMQSAYFGSTLCHL